MDEQVNDNSSGNSTNNSNESISNVNSEYDNLSNAPNNAVAESNLSKTSAINKHGNVSSSSALSKATAKGAGNLSKVKENELSNISNAKTIAKVNKELSNDNETESDKPMSEELEDGQIINTPPEGSPFDPPGSSSGSDSFEFRRPPSQSPRTERNQPPRARSRSPALLRHISPSPRESSGMHSRLPVMVANTPAKPLVKKK